MLLTTRAVGLLLASITLGQGATAPAIADVVAAGAPIELIQDGFTFTEGTVGTEDAGLLFHCPRSSCRV